MVFDICLELQAVRCYFHIEASNRNIQADVKSEIDRNQAKSLSNRAKTASVRFVAAKDHRKPVMAILHDHLDVPSIVFCLACSRLSM